MVVNARILNLLGLDNGEFSLCISMNRCWYYSNLVPAALLFVYLRDDNRMLSSLDSDASNQSLRITYRLSQIVNQFLVGGSGCPGKRIVPLPDCGIKYDKILNCY
ncbi:predicted protein [Sclerotinia sclerotiorum 1980 UF-70]|uniref:Uncharacterized protein n=1 Tax=Sclerotinia sclerotiorum (strain ATCC 18683 / 1980 / Ss-1) TaxID=665079 RepID=A7EAN6_SCLS1|nr:predicted protein [Sclerotinia sclerotiorum 1980 UF-70]EDN99514.1 predicted protein [Sclerotinia sclerotiorum 1980 UF-70]